MIPSRRIHARFACRLPCRVRVGTSAVQEGFILNVSVGGLHLAVKSASKGSAVSVELTLDGQAVALPGRVKWAAGKDPKNPSLVCYGVELAGDAAQEARLRLLVDRVRSGRL